MDPKTKKEFWERFSTHNMPSLLQWYYFTSEEEQKQTTDTRNDKKVLDSLTTLIQMDGSMWVKGSIFDIQNGKKQQVETYDNAVKFAYVFILADQTQIFYFVELENGKQLLFCRDAVTIRENGIVVYLRSAVVQSKFRSYPILSQEYVGPGPAGGDLNYTKTIKGKKYYSVFGVACQNCDVKQEVNFLTDQYKKWAKRARDYDNLRAKMTEPAGKSTNSGSGKGRI